MTFDTIISPSTQKLGLETGLFLKRPVQVVEEVVPDMDNSNVALDHGLCRGLKGRHFFLIALGSIIGPGTFYGLGYGLYLSGPFGLFIGFGAVGVAVWILMQAIGEVTAMFPVHGGFIEHANRFVDPALSFALSWLYYWNASVLILQLWVSDSTLPSWAWYLIFWGLYSFITTFGVQVYGELEYIFMFKFCALLVLFFTSILADVSAFGNSYVSFRYWRPPMAFFQGLICPSSASGLIHADSTVASSPFVDGFHNKMFVSSYITIPAFVLLFFGYKIVYKTR